MAVVAFKLASFLGESASATSADVGAVMDEFEPTLLPEEGALCVSVNGVVVDGPNELLVRGRAVAFKLAPFLGGRASDASASAEAVVDESELTLPSREGALCVSVNGVVVDGPNELLVGGRAVSLATRSEEPGDVSECKSFRR